MATAFVHAVACVCVCVPVLQGTSVRMEAHNLTPILVSTSFACSMVIAPAWEVEYGAYVVDKVAHQEEVKKKQEAARKTAQEAAAAAAATAAASGKKGKGKSGSMYPPSAYASGYGYDSTTYAYAAFKPSAGLAKALAEYDTAYRALTKWWAESSASSHEVFQQGLSSSTNASVKQQLSARIEAILSGTDALAPATKVTPIIQGMGYTTPPLTTFPSYGMAPVYNPTAKGATSSSAPSTDPYLSMGPGSYAQLYGPSSSSSTSAGAAGGHATNPANLIYTTGPSSYSGWGYSSYSYSSTGAASGTTFQNTVHNPQRTRWFDLAACTADAAQSLTVELDKLKKEDLEEE